MEVQIGSKMGCQMGRKQAPRMDVQIGAKMRSQIGIFSESNSKLVPKWGTKWNEKSFQTGSPSWCQPGQQAYVRSILKRPRQQQPGKPPRTPGLCQISFEQQLPGQPPRTPGLCQISFEEAQAAAARAASQDTRLMSDLF